jgi:hypothetical protein
MQYPILLIHFKQLECAPGAIHSSIEHTSSTLLHIRITALIQILQQPKHQNNPTRLACLANQFLLDFVDLYLAKTIKFGRGRIPSLYSNQDVIIIFKAAQLTNNEFIHAKVLSILEER